MKESVARFKELMTQNGAEIIYEEDWGLRKFAYPIKKKTTGYYHVFEYNAPTEFIQKLETEFNRDEKILRYISVALDKYGIQYNAKRRKEGKNSSPKQIEETGDLTKAKK
ncbi:MAG: 30S ribosomal protein S6 [Cytophagia bacterium]|nr:30S ribosomal protein S6 [Cytophagia bacterium]